MMKFDKIKQIFSKKNIKIIIPIIVLIVLLIVVIIYFSVEKYNNYRDKQEFSIYQYFAGSKIEYNATISFNRDKVIKAFVPKEYKINYTSTPVYYSDSENGTVVFPRIMSIILPVKSEFQFKIPEFSYIEKVNNLHYLTFEDYNKNIDHYILYDGDNLYFFSDSVTFTINGEVITLSPFSYVVASSTGFEYYDYETDTYMQYDNTNPVIIYNDYYELNASYDNLEYSNDKLLLISNFDYLSFLKAE